LYVLLKRLYLESKARYSKTDVIFGKAIKFSILKSNLIFHLSPSLQPQKGRQSRPICQNKENLVNFDVIFRGEGVEIEQI